MSSTVAMRNTRRLKRMLVTLLVILGTAISLLLAHSLEGVHAAEFTGGATSVSTSSAPLAASENGPTPVTASSEEDFLQAGVSLCAALGFACGIALLVVVQRLRNSSGRLARTRTIRWLPRVPRVTAPIFPVALAALCINRV